LEEKIYTREKRKGHILERISIGMQKGRRKKTEEKQRKYWKYA
jgi:hypothetical protein